MADNINNDSLVGSDSENFMRLMGRALARIEKVDSATNRANKSLQEYAKTFEKLNEELEDYVDLSGNVKTPKTGGSRTSGSPRGNKNSSGKKFDSVDKFFSTTSKFAKDIKKADISSTAMTAAKAYTTLGAKMAVATGAVGLVAGSIAILSKVTLDAHDNTVAYTRSLIQMGAQLNSLEKSSINTANEVNKLSNRWSNTMQTVGETFAPVLDLFVEWGNALLGWSSSEEPKKQKYGSQAEIVNSAKQSGFSADSSRALAGGTYEQAMILAEKYGQQASEVAKKLGEAWLTGSDAAKEYGVVVNDQVLTGYMASKGVDIANVEITDAMKQYYRYQLMLEQTQASNSDTMQDMIKEWTKLGFIIDKTKGKLFSFDEVIQLSAMDPNIPEVEGGLSGAEPEKPPINPGTTPGTGTDPKPNETLDKINDTVAANNKAVIDNTTAVDNLTEAVIANTQQQQIAQVVPAPHPDEIAASKNNLAAAQLNKEAAEVNKEVAKQNIIAAQVDANTAQVETVAAQTKVIAAQLNTTAAQSALMAAQTNMTAASMFGAAVGNIQTQIAAGAQQLGSVIGEAVNSGISKIETSTSNSLQVISSTANSEVSKIINIADYKNKMLNETAEQGKIAVGQTTVSGVNRVNSTANSNIININTVSRNNINNINTAGKSNVNSVNSAGKSNVININFAGKSNVSNVNSAGSSNISNINSTGQSWLSAIQSMGSQLLSSMASMAGLGGHMNVVGGAGRGMVSGFKSGGLSGAAKGGAKGAMAGAGANASAFINNPLDIVTESADLINSLKDENGNYNWKELPGAAGNMLVNSIVNPIAAIGNWGKLGWEQSKDQGHGWFLNALGAISGGITGGLAYTGAEFVGDLGALVETVQDGGLGLWNWITGDNVDNTTTGLTDFNNEYNKFLQDIVSGYNWQKNEDGGPQSKAYKWLQDSWNWGNNFANGGIGTKEINNATLFEGNKKEAVIPLETTAGIDYLSAALQKANIGDNGNTDNGNSVTINLTLSGVNIADNDAQWEYVGKKIAEVIDIQHQRRGELNYGSSF